MAKAVKQKAPKRWKGQPTKYREEYCEKLIAHMSGGLSFESFAGVVTVDRSTVYQWAKDNKDFSDAKKIGTERCRLFWEKLGIEGAMGGFEKFSAGTWVFNMKCRFPST